MKCLNCPQNYRGQIGRAFSIRYKEPIETIRNNASNSRYSSHILNTRHRFEKITETMDTEEKKTLENIGKMSHTQNRK
jgi:hypothetical protein